MGMGLRALALAVVGNRHNVLLLYVMPLMYLMQTYGCVKCQVFISDALPVTGGATTRAPPPPPGPPRMSRT